MRPGRRLPRRAWAGGAATAWGGEAGRLQGGAALAVRYIYRMWIYIIYVSDVRACIVYIYYSRSIYKWSIVYGSSMDVYSYMVYIGSKCVVEQGSESF